MAGTIKKGALVRVVTGNLENSLEALASDRRSPKSNKQPTKQGN